MSERERWVVYPLLFLAIGIATRSGIELQSQQQITEAKAGKFDSIRCKELQLIDDHDRVLITLQEASKQRAGAIMVNNTEGNTIARITADLTSGAGLVETMTANGTPQIVLTSNSNMAVIGMYDRGRLIPLVPADANTLPANPNQRDKRNDPSDEKSSEKR